MQIIISKEYDGSLLRSYLLGVMKLSHKLLTRLKAKPEGILLNGRHATVRATLHMGDCLTLALEDESAPLSAIPSTKVALPDILYEDDDLIVLNKPAHMPTHPSHGHTDDTLANALAQRACDQGKNILVFRPVNRLDRDTSGVVMVARHQLSAARLSEAMRARTIQKQYLALLEGDLPKQEGEIDLPIRRTADSIITRCVCAPDAPGAHHALTRYRVLHRFFVDGHSRTLVLAEPLTGRTHQLRVHFAHLGAPIVGDTLYGRILPELPTPDRQALHAYALTFSHPMTGEHLRIWAPLPQELSALLPEKSFSPQDLP